LYFSGVLAPLYFGGPKTKTPFMFGQRDFPDIWVNKRRLMLLKSYSRFNGYELSFSFLKTPTPGTAFPYVMLAPIFAAIFAVFRVKGKIKKKFNGFFSNCFCRVLVFKRI